MTEREFIMQMQPWFGDEEQQALSDYMDGGGFITEFRQTEKFASMLAEFIGVKHCIVVNNGTIRLSVAGLSCGLQRDDEVIVPS